VFLSYFFMAIMGGAILPKLMGHVADRYDMSRGFIVPACCFVIVAFYGFNWPRFSRAESRQAAKSPSLHGRSRVNSDRHRLVAVHRKPARP
jgi:FHS family L-fucose permease-like MFS transporter